MNCDARLNPLHSVRYNIWLEKVNAAREDGCMSRWISTIHPQRLRCELLDGSMSGSFNLCQTAIFSDQTTKVLRLPHGGLTHPEYADEKVVTEVGVLKLLRERTTIPVPVVRAWGRAADNILGLGPFILMDVAEGVSGTDLLSDYRTGTRLLRRDIKERKLEFLFRQFARFQLELFSLDFNSLGGVLTPEEEVSAPKRPLTWKAHKILHRGAVDTFGDREKSLRSSTEYFKYVFGQDWKRLFEQLNSVFSPQDARRMFRSFKALETLIPHRLVNKRWDRGPFKLICDGLGLANLMLKSEDDFTVVGVVDLEWSYIGPAQLAASAPWWLLQQQPTSLPWKCVDDEPPAFTWRYFKYLDTYKRVLREEETSGPGPEDHTFSELVQWSEDSGAMWLHMLVSFGIDDPDTFPLAQLRRDVGVEEWKALERRVDNTEVERFVERKLRHLKQYVADEEAIGKDKALVDKGELDKSAFIDRYRGLLPSGRDSGDDAWWHWQVALALGVELF